MKLKLRQESIYTIAASGKYIYELRELICRMSHAVAAGLRAMLLRAARRKTRVQRQYGLIR